MVENNEHQKQIIKEAFKEWLDEKAGEFGKWTFNFIFTAAFGALVYLLVTHGFLGK